MKEIKDDDLIGEQEFFNRDFSIGDFIITGYIIEDFIRENNEFAYTIDDIYEIILSPFHWVNPFNNDIGYYPVIKIICEYLVKKRELYRIDIDGEDYYYFFRIGRKKDNINNSILTTQDKGDKKKKYERKKH